MTKTTYPVIPGEQRETRNPSTCSWIPAHTGMTDGIVPSVSAHPISVQRYGVLRMTVLKVTL
jgi:hypothetical protein